MCRFGTGARSLMLLAMSLVEITAMGPSCSTLTTSVYVPAARRAVAVLTPFYYIESEGIVFPRGEVSKYPKPLPDYKMRQIDDYIHQDLSVMLLPSQSKMPKMVTKSWQWHPILYNFVSLSLLRARPTSLAFMIVLGSLPTARAVCTHCKDTITPTHADAACPLVVSIAANAQIFSAKTLGSAPTVTYSLTHELAAHFTRPVLDAIMGIACAPCQGAIVDLKATAYAAANAVVKAAMYGHCSFAEASAELAERLDGANQALEVDKIRGAMESLRLSAESVVYSSSGALAFIWAKVSNVPSKRDDPTFKLEVGKAKATSHTATLVRPKTEGEFYEMIHYFIIVIVALGMASATIVMKFFDDVVYGALRMKEPWKVGHELLMVYFREIDIDPQRAMHMGNVFRRGGQDTLLSEARRNAAAFFRAGGANLQLGGAPIDTSKDPKDLKPNGKGDDKSKRPCADFNAGRPCKQLKPDGSCVFAHACNQFVSDKGPNGYCFGPHARGAGCSYDDAKKLRVAAK